MEMKEESNALVEASEKSDIMGNENQLLTRRFTPEVLAANAFKKSSLRPWILPDILDVLWAPSSMSAKEKSKIFVDALNAFLSIEPRDEFERMLAQQMVACHSAAMECFRRAALENQTHSGRDTALKHAARLLAAQTKLVVTLDKHRSKGQQKMTIENVHVHPGGQAIVGSASGSKLPLPASDLGLIENKPELPFVKVEPRKRAVRIQKKAK